MPSASRRALDRSVHHRRADPSRPRRPPRAGRSLAAGGSRGDPAPRRTRRLGSRRRTGGRPAQTTRRHAGSLDRGRQATCPRQPPATTVDRPRHDPGTAGVIGRDQLRRWVDHYGTPVSQVQRDHLISHVLARLPGVVPHASAGLATVRGHRPRCAAIRGPPSQRRTALPTRDSAAAMKPTAWSERAAPRDLCGQNPR